MTRGVIAAVLVSVLGWASSSAGAGPVVVSRGSAALPPGCGAAEAATLMLTFMTAYNADDEAQLDRLFAPAGPNLREGVLGESGFVELTRSNQRLGTTGATERAGLLPYVAARHRAHEQLLLLWIEAAPDRRTWPARAQITYELNVRANDLPGGTRLLWGKGELNCASRTIPLLQMDLFEAGTEPTGPTGCPRPAGWTPGAAILACAARPTAWSLADDFTTAPTKARLAQPCGRDRVAAQVASTLDDWNWGRPRALSRHFTKRGQFHAYTGTIHGTGSVGRAQIARFAAARAAAGDGWTATVLHAPVGKPAPPTRAVYGLGLRIYRNGLAARSGGAKLVVDCRSGLLLKWIGPGTTAPRD